MADIRAELEGRYVASVGAACAGRGAQDLSGPGGPRLVPALRESLAFAAELHGGACPEETLLYYTERMPRLLVEQLLCEEPAGALLDRRLDLAALPRLREALAGVMGCLRAAGLSPEELLGAASPEGLLAARPTIWALYRGALFGAGMPLLGAYPAEREVLSADLQAGRAEDEIIDLRLSGNLVHELCHGPQVELRRPPAWMLQEAAAIFLGAEGRPAHVFPQEPGEAVPGVSLFVLVGQGLARLFGRRAIWQVARRPLLELLPARVATALQAAGWQEFHRRGRPPFVQDALRADAWLKLADACRGEALGALGEQLDRQADVFDGRGAGLLELPDLLAAADRLLPRDLPWWGEEPGAEDEALAARAVLAMFQVQRLAPTFQTHPSEPPEGRLLLHCETCRLEALPRPGGAYGEPAYWLFPPPLCRGLTQRGARLVRIEGARRDLCAAITEALRELCRGAGQLPDEVVLSWTSSRTS